MPRRESIEAQIEEVRQRRSKTLNLRDRGLKRIPVEIYELVHLEELDLYWNQIRARAHS